MKKICLIITCVLASTVVFAQHGAKFGLKGGLNVASLKFDNTEEVDARLGLHLGVLTHLHLAPQWALQPEVVYSQEGAKFSDPDGITVKTDYINVPVMIQYMFNNGFRLEAGPQLGLAVNQKIEDDESDEEVDADDLFKSTNVSVGLGVSYLTYSGIGIGARYNLGLSNISESDDNEIKGRNFQISLFYMFDSQHKAKSR